MIAIIGANGSMGKRYQAILSYLGEKFIPLDRDSTDEIQILQMCMNCDRVILASPTQTHVDWLYKLLPLGKKVLCEKPVSKNIDDLNELMFFCNKNGYVFDMVMQYAELVDQESRGSTYYNYFRTGNDGLVWDCMQIIGLAKDDIFIDNHSPIWKCRINGQQLSLADMDRAYLLMIRRWLRGEAIVPFDTIFSIHQKVCKFMKKDQNDD